MSSLSIASALDGGWAIVGAVRDEMTRVQWAEECARTSCSQSRFSYQEGARIPRVAQPTVIPTQASLCHGK